MDQFNDFGSMYAYLFGLYQQGSYADALAIAEREFERFPRNKPMLYHFRACMSGKLNDKAGVLAVFTEALDSGLWYPENFWMDDDLAVLRGDPEFERLQGISAERYAQVMKTSKPELTVYAPDEKKSRPLLLALHGNMTDIVNSEAFWFPATHHNWIVALPQSSQIVGPGMYVWNDTAVADKELTAHFQTLCDQYSVDAQRVILGGFSMGGETVIRTSLQGLLPVRGFIAVTPGGPLTREPANWQPLIDGAKGKNLRGAIIVGGQDEVPQQTRQLAQMLNDAGIECKLLDYPEMGHTFPPDFAERLPELLAFIAGE